LSKKKVSQISFSCFLNKETGQLFAIPKEIDFLADDLDDHFFDEYEAWQEDIQLIKNSPDSFLQIENMDSTDSFGIMEDFIKTIADNQYKKRLLKSIQMRNPFAHFKENIDDLPSERERWFEFKKQRVIEWVKRQIDIS
jgi:Uncharacterised protein family (UPF0158)